jgi:hypothetical protein
MFHMPQLFDPWLSKFTINNNFILKKIKLKSENKKGAAAGYEERFHFIYVYVLYMSHMCHQFSSLMW